MISTLIKKDSRLLRNYLLAAIAVTIGCYVSAAIAVIWLTAYQDESMQEWHVRSLLILRGGRNVGLWASALCSLMIAGSVFTLERADRSAEFLACLPPRRLQHLISKLSILFGTLAGMLIIHLMASIFSALLLPYVSTTNIPFNDGMDQSALVMFIAVNLLAVGGALAVSAWQNSNGVPILCGLLLPMVLMFSLQLFAYVLDVSPTEEEQVSRFTVAAFVVGAVLIFCGAYWYVERDEP